MNRILAERERRHLSSLDDALGPQAAGERLAAYPGLGVLSFEATEMRVEGIGRASGTVMSARAMIGILPSAIIVRNWQEDAGAGLALAPRPIIRLRSS